MRLISPKAVRLRALEDMHARCVLARVPRTATSYVRFTRVSGAFILEIENAVRDLIQQKIAEHPLLTPRNTIEADPGQ